MFQTLKNKSKRIASTLAAGVLLFSQLAVVPVASANPDQQQNQVNDWCTISQTSGGVKFETGAIGDHTEDPITITIGTGDNDKTQVNNATGDNVVITKVVVKGGNSDQGNGGNGNQYYDAPLTFPLLPPLNNGGQQADISHVIVCYDNQPEDPDYGSIRVSKKVDKYGSGNFVDGNDMNFAWGLDAETPERAMGSTANNVTVGKHNVTEKLVNGYEFVGWYYAFGDEDHNWYKSCTNPLSTSLPTDIDVKKDDTRKIVLCNKVKESSITIVKDSQPNSGENFKFEIDKVNSQWDDEFWLDDDNNPALSNTKVFDDRSAGTYVVREVNVDDDWKLADIVCSEGATVNVNVAERKVVITLNAGDAVTCTFVNKKKGLIKVTKHTDPYDHWTDFKIKASGTGNVYGSEWRWIEGGEHEYFTVDQGTYNVDEIYLPAGWIQTGNTCANIVISPEDLYTECHIYNAKEAKLKIVKVANPADGQDFAFTSEQLGDFSLDVDDDATLKDYQRFSGLEADVYSVTEQAIANWKLTGVSCNISEKDYQVLSNGTLNVKLDAGDNVTCYFYNEKLNTVSGHKFNDVNGNHKWDDGEPGLANWTITIVKNCDAHEQAARFLQQIESEESEENEEEACEPFADETVTDVNGAYSFTNLEPGRYTVCELQKANWTQTYPETEDGCHEVVVEGPGEVVTANFGNKAKPQVLGDQVTLAVTGATTTGKSLAVGLSILGALGALHLLVTRRKDYAR